MSVPAPAGERPARAARGAGRAGAAVPVVEAIGPLVHGLAKSWRQELDRRLRPLGLTRAQWQALLLVSRAPRGLTQRELADALDIGAPATVALVDRMERDGLVARAPVPGDRRRNAVRATASSRRLFARIEAAAAELRREIFSEMTTAEVLTLQRLLTRARERVEAVRT